MRRWRMDDEGEDEEREDEDEWDDVGSPALAGSAMLNDGIDDDDDDGEEEDVNEEDDSNSPSGVDDVESRGISSTSSSTMPSRFVVVLRTKRRTLSPRRKEIRVKKNRCFLA